MSQSPGSLTNPWFPHPGIQGPRCRSGCCRRVRRHQASLPRDRQQGARLAGRNSNEDNCVETQCEPQEPGCTHLKSLLGTLPVICPLFLSWSFSGLPGVPSQPPSSHPKPPWLNSQEEPDGQSWDGPQRNVLRVRACARRGACLLLHPHLPAWGSPKAPPRYTKKGGAQHATPHPGWGVWGGLPPRPLTLPF